MTDFLVGILLAPMHAAQLVSRSLQHNCTFNDTKGHLSFLLLAASVSSILLISYDRYVHLTKTQNYSQFMSKRKVIALIAVAWAMPALMVMLDILGGKNIRSWRYARITAFVFGCLCFVGVVACYACIMTTVRRKEKKMVNYQAQDGVQQRRIRNDIRAAKVITTIIVCFLITIIPTAIYACVVAIATSLPNGIPGFNKMSMEIFYTIVVTLTMGNSGINPLIYNLRNPKFRESLLKGLKRFYQSSRRSNRLNSECTRADNISRPVPAVVP